MPGSGSQFRSDENEEPVETEWDEAVRRLELKCWRTLFAAPAEPKT